MVGDALNTKPDYSQYTMIEIEKVTEVPLFAAEL